MSDFLLCRVKNSHVINSRKLNMSSCHCSDNVSVELYLNKFIIDIVSGIR